MRHLIRWLISLTICLAALAAPVSASIDPDAVPVLEGARQRNAKSTCCPTDPSRTILAGTGTLLLAGSVLVFPKQRDE